MCKRERERERATHLHICCPLPVTDAETAGKLLLFDVLNPLSLFSFKMCTNICLFCVIFLTGLTV